MINDLLNWNIIYSIFSPCFILGLGVGLVAFLLGYGLKFIFALFEDLI